jgi:hypothetical protein
MLFTPKLFSSWKYTFVPTTAAIKISSCVTIWGHNTLSNRRMDTPGHIIGTSQAAGSRDANINVTKCRQVRYDNQTLSQRWFGRSPPTFTHRFHLRGFGRQAKQVASRACLVLRFSPGLLFDTEHGRDTFLRNVSRLLQDYTVLRPRWSHSSRPIRGSELLSGLPKS